MDVSTLFAAPNTAASATALSFGALAGNGGNATTAGDGLEGQDSFNQLLGNFLSVTASDATGPVLAADGNVVVDGESMSVAPALPQGTAALMGAGLLKGVGVGATPIGQVQVGRSVEGRWAQSGLNLLAAGGLAGQEMNQEVISFLNDLSQAITAQDESTISTPQEITAAPVIESEGTEMLVVLQGEGAPAATPANANAPANIPAATVSPLFLTGSNNGTQVIPKGDMTRAPGQLGITLTAAGTGLTSLPTAMMVEDARLPVSSPVIPRALPVPQTAVSPAPQGTVVPSSTPAVTTPSMPAVTAPTIPVRDSGTLSDVKISAVSTPTDSDEGDGVSAVVETVADISATAPAMPTQAAPVELLPTPSTASATPVPAPAIVPTPDLQRQAADIQPSTANTPVVTLATDQPVPVEAAPVTAVPGKGATPPRTINTSTASAPMRAPSVDDKARANGNVSPTLATDDSPASDSPALTQTASAPALATDKSSSAMVAAADPEIADDKVATAPAPVVAVELAAPRIAATEAPTVAATTPQAVPIADDPAPTLSVAPATAPPVDVSQRTTTPSVAVPAAPVERQDVPATKGQATPVAVALDAPTIPDTPAVEQSAAGRAATAVPRQSTVNAQVTEPTAEATPAPTIPAQNVDTAESAPPRPMTNAAPAAPADTDRVAALSIPVELVTEAGTKAPAPPVTAVTAPPVEPTQTSVQPAPITPPVSAPQRTMGAQALTTPIPDAAPQSPSPVIEGMSARVATTDAPVPAATPVPADTPSISGATAGAQDTTPTDAPVVRIVTDPALKTSAAVKPMMPAAPSSTTPASDTTESLASDPSLALADAATAPTEAGNPKVATVAPARVTVTMSRTTIPAVQTPRTQLAAAEQGDSGLTVGDDVTEDVDATNEKMLAPKHLGEESRLAEAQSDIGSQAQSAGQNNTAARQDTLFVRSIGGAEDSLLARAVTAVGKGHESNAGGEEGSSADPEKSAEMLDSMTSPATGGETAKTQNSDFAQSLRQTAAPHRTGTYLPPTHQMAMQVQRAIQDGNERLSIRLNPQELGRIDVQLEIGSEGKLRAKVMVENPQTLEMLQKDAKSLEKALQDAGLQTDQDSLSFSLQDSGDQTQQRRDQSGQSGNGTAIASDTGELEDPAILAQTQILELGRVDVVV